MLEKLTVFWRELFSETAPQSDSASRSDEHGKPVFRIPPLKKLVNCSATNRSIEIP